MMRTLTILLCGVLPIAAADWLTYGADPQRTGWAKSETKLTRDNVKNLQLDWKVKLDNESKELNSLTAPLILEDSYTPKGVKDVLVIAGASDNLYAIDAETGKQIWKKTFQAEGASKQKPHWLCPNSLNATPVIARQRGLGGNTVFAIASDGKLHSLNVVNGEDRFPPKQFVPPFSKNWSLNYADGVLYTATSQGCGGAKSAVYALDTNKPDLPVTMFLAAKNGGGIWGRAGVAVSSGVVYAETGDGPYDPNDQKLTDTILGVAAGDLKLKDYYTPANRAWITKKDLDMGNMSPVVFPYKKWELVAGSGKEGVIYLLDAKALGGADHKTPLFRSPLYTNEDVDFAGRGFWGAFATFEDDKGTRWLYAPAWGPQHSESPRFEKSHGETPNGSIMAFRVEEKDGKPVLAPAWRSRDMNVPEPPVVAGGVVFALSSGENVRQLDSGGRILNSKQRAESPVDNVKLFAFDAKTGEVLFSSGATMSGFTHFTGIAVNNGRVFVTTYENVVYAFGLKE